MDRENLYDHDKQALLRDLENKKEGAVDYLFRTYYADLCQKEEGRNAALWEAVNSLPEQCRVILKLVVLEEMKYAEVAEKLGISLNTVKTQMKIAYRELRGKLSGKQLFLLFFQMKA